MHSHSLLRWICGVCRAQDGVYGLLGQGLCEGSELLILLVLLRTITRRSCLWKLGAVCKAGRLVLQRSVWDGRSDVWPTHEGQYQKQAHQEGHQSHGN